MPETKSRKRTTKSKDGRAKGDLAPVKFDYKNPPHVVTPDEFRRHFKIGRTTVNDMMDDGRLLSLNMPTADPQSAHKIRRIPWSEVLRFDKLFGINKPKEATTAKTGS